MKEKLQEYALLAEIISAVVIVISLFFVGFQIQDGNRETRAATVQAQLNAEMNFQSEILRYANIWDKVSKGEQLDEGEEFRRALILYNMMMALNENRYEQFKAGYLDAVPSIEVNGLIDLPIFNQWISSPGGNSRSPDFLEYIDSLRTENNTE